MDYEKLKLLIEEAINNSDLIDWWVYFLIFIIVAIGSSLGSYFGSYLKRKAENVAIKEDIGKITSIMEEIRLIYTTQLETTKASLELSNQLKLTALDIRLQKHQEAYTHWLNLMRNLHHEKIGKFVIECEKWWTDNCLYLEPDARKSFKTASLLAVNFRELRDAKDKRQWFDTINEAGEKIVEAVGLLSLGDDETKSSEFDPSNPTDE